MPLYERRRGGNITTVQVGSTRRTIVVDPVAGRFLHSHVLLVLSCGFLYWLSLQD